MKTVLSLLLIVFTFLGILDASYITYEKLSGYIPPCNLHFKCGEVLNSAWSSIGPIPLSVFGVFFYSTFFVIALLFYFERKQIVILKHHIPLENLLALLGIIGFGFSIYLVFVMGVILKAWCIYCLLSAATCFILFLTSSSLFFLIKRESINEVHI